MSTEPKPVSAAQTAEEESDVPALPDMFLPDPFAFANSCTLLPADGQKVPGCFVSLQCGGCGQRMKFDLLAGGVKSCPNKECGLQYTTALLVARADDMSIVNDFVRHVEHANFVIDDEPEEDDDAADADGGDDDDDDDDDDDSETD